MSLGEICNRDVVFATRTNTITEAAQLMREHHVGDLVVIDETDKQRRPVGMLTDRDIVIELIAKNIDIHTVTVGDVMSTELIAGRESDGIYETIQLMRNKGVRRLPVVNQKGGLVGIVAVDDLLDLLAEEFEALSRLPLREQARERAARPS